MAYSHEMEKIEKLFKEVDDLFANKGDDTVGTIESKSKEAQDTEIIISKLKTVYSLNRSTNHYWLHTKKMRSPLTIQRLISSTA